MADKKKPVISALTDPLKQLKESALDWKKATLEIDAFNKGLVQSNAYLAQHAEAANRVNDRLMEIAKANQDVGLTSAETNKIYDKLSRTLSSRVRKGFDDTAGALVQQAKLWENLGVATETSTKFIDLFDTALGSSTNQIIKTGRVLHDFAARTGQDANRVFKDLAGSANSFFDILDQGEMTKQMLTFQGRARATGMSMSGLMGIMDKFETIGGAQEAGAKLNATLTALGGGFDAVKASALDYPERMNYIASAIQRVMPRIRRSNPRAQRLYMRSLRESLGVSSAVEFRKLLQYKPGQVLAEGDLRAGRITGISATNERAAAARAATMQEKFEALLDAVNKFTTRAAAAALGTTAPAAVGFAKEMTTSGAGAAFNAADDALGYVAGNIGTLTKSVGILAKTVETLQEASKQHQAATLANTTKMVNIVTKMHHK